MATTSPHIDQLASELHRLIGKLEEALSTTERVAHSSPWPTVDFDIEAVLQQLKQLLSIGELEAQHYFAKHTRELLPLLGGLRMQRLEQQITQFNFEQALAELEAPPPVPG